MWALVGGVSYPPRLRRSPTRSRLTAVFDGHSPQSVNPCPAYPANPMRLLMRRTLGAQATVELTPPDSDSGLVAGHHAHLRRRVLEVVGRSQVLVRAVWPCPPLRSEFERRDSAGCRADTRSPYIARLPSVPTRRTSSSGNGSRPSLYPRSLARRVSDTCPGCRVLASSFATPRSRRGRSNSPVDTCRDNQSRPRAPARLREDDRFSIIEAT
jgi:hypothetical protein